MHEARDWEAEQDAKTGGAILVHSLTNGRPDLDAFMERLEEAMEKCRDPVFMQQISARYVDSRRSKKYTLPPAMLAASFDSVRGSIAAASRRTTAPSKIMANRSISEMTQLQT